MFEAILVLHTVFALVGIWDGVRHRVTLSWIICIGFVPVLGSITYFVKCVIPRFSAGWVVEISGEHYIAKQRALDIARQAYDHSPSLVNHMAYAQACMQAQQDELGVEIWEACLAGPWGGDPDVLLCAAKGMIEAKRNARAIELLTQLKNIAPKYHAQELNIQLGWAYMGLNQIELARQQFLSLIESNPSLENRVECALWAISAGDRLLAARQKLAISFMQNSWSEQQFIRHADKLETLDRACQQAGIEV